MKVFDEKKKKKGKEGKKKESFIPQIYPKSSTRERPLAKWNINKEKEQIINQTGRKSETGEEKNKIGGKFYLTVKNNSHTEKRTVEIDGSMQRGLTPFLNTPTLLWNYQK